MALNVFSGRRKRYLWWLIIGLAILLAFTLNIGSKGTSYIANRSANPIYSWKAAALQMRGGVVPDSCALTTKNCVCNLSESMPNCTFNFNFHDLNSDVSIDVKQDQLAPLIVINKSSGCSNNKPKQIENCSVAFQWTKKDAGSKAARIVMQGSNGIQPIVNLQITAK